MNKKSVTMTDLEWSTNRVKQSIEFLDNPLFITSRNMSKLDTYTYKNVTITTLNGYTLPTMFDRQIMYMLLHIAQQEKSEMLYFNSIYEILGILRMDTHNKFNYDRVKESLKRWHSTSIYHDKGTYKFTVPETGEVLEMPSFDSYYVIKHLDIDESGGVSIWIEDMIMKKNEASYTMSLLLKTLMDFKNPLALRLYEIMIKSFNSSRTYKINLQKLFAKCAASYKERKRAIDSLDVAMKHINTIPGMTELKYEIGKNNIVTFTKM